jgi:pectinesterase
MAGMAGFVPAHALFSRYDAVVKKNPAKGEFATISEAVKAAPGDKPFRILVTAGTWRERVSVEKPFVELIGEGIDKTTIVSNASAGDLGADGKPIGTFNTPTVYVKAPDFRARDITISNDYDYVGHLPKPNAEDKTGPSGSQAVALAVQDNADRSYFENVRLYGNQDTLFVNTGRSVFRKCQIEGNVDFIFGAGIAVFDDCRILSVYAPGRDFNGFIVAPDTKVYQPYGFVFRNCRLEKQAGQPLHSMALGRGWRRTGSFPDGKYGDPEAVGAAVYLNCWMDDHIVPEGWYPMGYSRKDGTRTQLEPEEARFFEFGSTGPGTAPASTRRRILSAEQAKAYDLKLVLGGWMP